MGENANDRFERLAAEFYAATGMLAPGKDQPGAMGGSREDYDRRVDAWRAWNAERYEAMERDAARWQAVRGCFDVESQADAFDEGPWARGTTVSYLVAGTIDETAFCLEGDDRTVEQIVDAAIRHAAKVEAELEALEEQSADALRASYIYANTAAPASSSATTAPPEATMTRTDEAPVAVRERPVFFSAPMVRAILSGEKSQTRRVVKPQPPEWAGHVNAITHLNRRHAWVPAHLFQWSELEQTPPRTLRRWPVDEAGDRYAIPCPYGRPGDRLWVRESIRFVGATPMGDLSEYIADGTLTEADGWPWKRNVLPCIHCPRGLSRITLEITGVRVERVQDISEDDAEREGVNAGDPYEPGDFRDAFHALWDSINAKRGHGWDVNPWVWVIDFRTVETTT